MHMGLRVAVRRLPKCSTRISRLFMGGSRKEVILFERAVASGATGQTTSFSAIDN